LPRLSRALVSLRSSLSAFGNILDGSIMPLRHSWAIQFESTLSVFIPGICLIMYGLAAMTSTLPSRTERIGCQNVPVDSTATELQSFSLSHSLNLISSGTVVPNSPSTSVPSAERIVATTVFLWISAPQALSLCLREVHVASLVTRDPSPTSQTAFTAHITVITVPKHKAVFHPSCLKPRHHGRVLREPL